MNMKYTNTITQLTQGFQCISLEYVPQELKINYMLPSAKCIFVHNIIGFSRLRRLTWNKYFRIMYTFIYVRAINVSVLYDSCCLH